MVAVICEFTNIEQSKLSNYKIIEEHYSIEISMSSQQDNLNNELFLTKMYLMVFVKTKGSIPAIDSSEFSI